MKLAINATILSSKPAGISVYALNMINELLPLLEGNEVTVYTTCPELIKPSGAKIMAVSKRLSPNYGKLSGLLRFFWTQFILPLKLRKLKAEKLYSPSHHGCFFMKNQVITVLDLIPLKYPKQHRLQGLYYKYFLPLLLKRAESIVTISEDTRKDIESTFGVSGGKIKVAYCGYDTANFFPRETAQKNIAVKYGFGDYFLVVGATYPHKNVEAALQALKKSGLDSGLVIIGKGIKGYEIKLSRLTEELSLGGKVAFVSYAPYHELPELYSGARALLYLSLYEGFGMPPLEAMACGCPVITSKLSSLPEVVGECAMYVNPLDSADIANAMKTVCIDKTLTEKLSKEGLIRSKQFNWKAEAAKVLPVIVKP
ncbi:MAG: glycosyltransferase family 1 protein [Candidatus Firestonebacteria bacterium]